MNLCKFDTEFKLFKKVCKKVMIFLYRVFLAEQFSYLKQYIERLIPDANKEALEQYVNEVKLLNKLLFSSL